MPGSLTTPGRPGTRADAPGHIAFRSHNSVGIPEIVTFAAQWLACPHPCQRFAPDFAASNA
jgi:hypothetical protein